MIQLSSTSLGLYKECPKCFWRRFNRDHKRPRGIFPSLPGGMDNVIKVYFDKYREKGELPPELEEKVNGKLAGDIKWIEKWRSWRNAPSYIDRDLGVKVVGGIDDCLIDQNGVYTPFDYKTRGYAPKGNSEEYYQHQLDIYSLLLSENEEESYPISEFGYLFYYYPNKVEEAGVIRFDNKLVKIETSKKRIKSLIKEALDCLDNPEPEHHEECEYCLWLERFQEFD